jgi:large subunit ribosomal protein L6
MKRYNIEYKFVGSYLNFSLSCFNNPFNLSYNLPGFKKNFNLTTSGFVFFCYFSYRAFICNLIKLVSSLNSGYYSDIITRGVGYKFYRGSSNILMLVLGHSHRIILKVPNSIIFQLKKNKLVLFSFDKILLNNYSKFIRNLRHPDPYKGKGLKFNFEVLSLKEGKKRQR